MKALTQESGLAVLIIVAVAALAVGLALAVPGACW
jgi:hypothetical protein